MLLNFEVVFQMQILPLQLKQKPISNFAQKCRHSYYFSSIFIGMRNLTEKLQKEKSSQKQTNTQTKQKNTNTHTKQRKTTHRPTHTKQNKEKQNTHTHKGQNLGDKCTQCQSCQL